ncbi:lectin-like protein [Annulohypoxylon nitens]|nr:lectin-like protein [Annulohypoxylon nitens]
MSSPYTVKVSIFQTNPNGPLFQIAEKAVWYFGSGGEWSESNTAPTLTMPDTDTAGMLRFIPDATPSSNREIFVVAVGIHNSKHWVDIVTNIKNTETTPLTLSQYYRDTGNTQEDRVNAREAQRDSWEAVNNKGRKISAKFTTAAASKDQELIVVVG